MEDKAPWWLRQSPSNDYAVLSESPKRSEIIEYRSHRHAPKIELDRLSRRASTFSLADLWPSQ